jgi:peptidyl-dipeptidase Dcp
MKKYLLILSIILMTQAFSTQKEKAVAFDASNPFYSEYSTPLATPPFDAIKTEHFKPAIIAGIEQQSKEIDSIADNPKPATFENTIVAMDESGRLLSRVNHVFDAINGANTDSVIQAIADTVTPLMSEHRDNIYLNEKLFARIKAVHDDSSAVSSLTMEQKRLLDNYYKDFVRSGIMLNKEQKERLREINKQLDLLSLSFGKNLLAETNDYKLVIDNKDDLAGLPDDVVAIAAQTAKDNGMDGKWIFTTSRPSWEPFMQFEKNRSLREKLYKAMYSRCNNGNAYDNKENIKNIVNLRLEKAKLLGFPTSAAYVLDETMAKTPENVFKLLNDIWKYALPKAKEERAELQQMIKAEGGDFKLESWDWWYYAEKLRKQKYDLNEDEIKPYFVMENVVRDGAFACAHKLYGLNFTEIKNIPVYQKDVKVFKVTDADSSYVGVIFLDYFPRAGKRAGAWMSNLTEQSVREGKFIHPIVYNVANLNPPSGNTPSLLNIDQVETIFHEFGHALQGLLSKCNYEGVSGTNVYRDFVELPSQINEHWATNPEVLKMYAKHYQTGKTIPDELVQKIQKAKTFNQGFMTTELVAAAILDMKWHTIESPLTVNVDTFENKVLNDIGLIPEIIVRYKSPYFAHIFDGGYYAGYYSYLWAEVLDADAFQAFVEKGVFDQATAKSFRDNILSKGDTEDPMVLYRRFRGADPNPDYLLKNRGLKN